MLLVFFGLFVVSWQLSFEIVLEPAV